MTPDTSTRNQYQSSDAIYIWEMVSLAFILIPVLGILISQHFPEKELAMKISIASVVVLFFSVTTAISLLLPIIFNGRARTSISDIIIFSIVAILLDFLFVILFLRENPNWGNNIREALLKVGLKERNITTGFAFLYLMKTVGTILGFYALLRSKDLIIERLDQYQSESLTELVKSLVGMPGYKGRAWLMWIVSLRYWKRPYLDYRLACFLCIGIYTIFLPLNDLSNFIKIIAGISYKGSIAYVWQFVLLVVSIVIYMAWVANFRLRTTILHLSDIHISSNQEAEAWSSQLVDDLFYNLKQRRVGWLIISGDIANTASEDEYRAAALLISNLCANLNISKERVIISPGNHDVCWTASEKAYKMAIQDPEKIKSIKADEKKRELCIPFNEDLLQRDEKLYMDRLLNFANFYKTCTDTNYSLEYHDQATLCWCQKSRVLILSLNSAWEIDHHYKKRVSINENALSKAFDRIRSIDPERVFLKIAVWHHPMKLESDAPMKHHGFVQRLVTHGFRIVLNGHVHMAALTTYNQDVAHDGRWVSMISAGTFGAPTREWRPGYPLQYNFISVYKSRLIVDTRCRSEPNGAWQPDARWTRNEHDTPRPWYEILIR